MALGEWIDHALYSDHALKIDELFVCVEKIVELSERFCPTWSPYHLMPPSDIQRALPSNPHSERSEER